MAYLNALTPGCPVKPWSGFATANGSSDIVPVIPSADPRILFWQLIFDAAPTAITFKLQGSNDGVTWVDLVSTTSVAGDCGLVAAPAYVRGNISGLNKGGNSTTTLVLRDAGIDDVSKTLIGCGIQEVVTLAAGDGAIAAKTGVVLVTKGSAAALTLAAPTAGDDDGKVLRIYTTGAYAHTVTNASPGFNNGGAASDVATFTAAIGNGMELVAYKGVWYTLNLRGVTLG